MTVKFDPNSKPAWGWWNGPVTDAELRTASPNYAAAQDARLLGAMARPAGAELNLPAALVTYIGEQAQAGRTDPAVLSAADQAIAERVGAAVEAAMADQLAGSPSFNVRVPKIPGRDLEGVPNADDPVMREKLRQRFLKNPHGGEELPGFLKGA